MLSLGGVGFFPWAPGTMGTLVTLPFLYLATSFDAPRFLFAPFILAVTVYSCFMAHLVQKEKNLHDPSWIVMDEAVGMGMTWLFLASTHWSHLLIGFALFRFFDIVKIWPASFFDKKVHHGAGTILDDIVSGIYAGLFYLGLNFLGWLP